MWQGLKRREAGALQGAQSSFRDQAAGATTSDHDTCTSTTLKSIRNVGTELNGIFLFAAAAACCSWSGAAVPNLDESRLSVSHLVCLGVGGPESVSHSSLSRVDREFMAKSTRSGIEGMPRRP